MTDNLTPAQRSHTMSRIRSRGNEATELTFVRLLRTGRIAGWRRGAQLPGKPDFVFRMPRIAIFVDGCFWHGCPRCFLPPKSNRVYWARKIAKNKARDRTVSVGLRRRGWTVVRVWQHALRTRPRQVLRRLVAALVKLGGPIPGDLRRQTRVDVNTSGLSTSRRLATNVLIMAGS